MRENCSSDQGNVFKFEAEGREFAKILRGLYTTIYLNSDRSQQFLKTEYFFNLCTPGGFSDLIH